MEYPGKTNRNAWQYAALLIIICLAAPFVQVQAQPELTFKRVAVNWPTIELFFSAECGGNPSFSMTKQDICIHENGIEVTDFTLTCPNPAVRCIGSVALVFDATSSMTASANAGAKQAGHAFINAMNGVSDEAAVLWFGQAVTIRQQITTSKALLHSAVDSLPIGGEVCMWECVHAGLLELISNGVNPYRALIVMMDGYDNSSIAEAQMNAALARQHHIRLFTIALGTNFNTNELEYVVPTTGGRVYKTADPGQLAAIYQEISGIVASGFRECMIAYDRECADGGLRTVELRLKDYCGGTDTETKQYLALRDTSTFRTLSLELGRGSVASNGTITIPLNLLTPLNAEMFFPFEFTLEHDTSCAKLLSVSTPPGSLIEGLPLSVTTIAMRSLIRINDRKLISGSGLLLELQFRASDPDDTLCCGIYGSNAVFEQGCLSPVITPGEICILPRLPEVYCGIERVPGLTWNKLAKDYTPSPFPVRGVLLNVGDKEARNARFRIAFDTATLRLAAPVADVQAASPPDVQPAGESEAVWQLAANCRASSDSTMICITASFDNHPDVICCTNVFIPQTGPLVDCALDAPVIIADTVNSGYDPMPFPITVTANNTGLMQTEPMFASIILPPDLELAYPDAPDRNTKSMVPSQLNPGQSANLAWMVHHPHSDADKHYTVTVWVKTANTDSSKCEVNITIPGYVLNRFAFKLAAQGSTALCQGDSVILDAGNGYASYRWSHGPQTQRVPITAAGLYFCTVQQANGSIGYSDTVQVTVSPRPSPRLNVSGPTTICEGDSLRLSVSGSYQTYQWSNGGTNPDIIVRASGAYYVRVGDRPFCMGESDTVVVTVLRNLTPRIFPIGSRTLCEGDSLHLSVSGIYPSYQWSNGSTDSSIIVTAPGTYYVRVSSSLTCTGISDTVVITFLPKPYARLVITGSTEICEGDSVFLSVGSGFLSYLWNNGLMTPGISVKTAGSYYVEVSNSAGCRNLSDTVVVTKKPSPPKPGVQRNGNVLSTDPAVSYRWYRNGLQLPSASSQSLSVTESGQYQVQVTNAEGCPAMSDPFGVTVLETGHEPAIAEGRLLNVWPEPATDVLRIGLTGAENQTVTLALYDVLGRAEIIHTGILPDGGAVFTHSLRDRKPGVYYLVALLGDAVLVKRVTKM